MNENPLSRGEPSDAMPSISTTIRLDNELMAATRAEAERLGCSWSEYVRQALMARLVWSYALQAVEAGSDPDILGVFSPADRDAILTILRRVAERDAE